MIDVTTRAASERFADEPVSWLDSEQFEALLLDARADVALLRELDELLPDTIAEL
ncbi:MAG TPA: hypothetical protein VFS59_16255 [Gemmatimonadaceae bacterium]|nr:hypothetical protein [Gemmatimonadaceae bacterium]